MSRKRGPCRPTLAAEKVPQRMESETSQQTKRGGAAQTEIFTLGKTRHDRITVEKSFLCWRDVSQRSVQRRFAFINKKSQIGEAWLDYTSSYPHFSDVKFTH